jgi:hypothetical protein
VVDDPVCVFPDLPTFVWTENPFDSLGSIHVDRGEAHCADGDMISISGQRAAWLFALEVPEPVYVEMHMSVPVGTDFDAAWLGLASCNGKVDPEWMAYYIFSVGYSEWILDGRHVGALIGEIRPDGTVDLPSVSFEELPHI